ncbi:hypothetical protein [Amycolatopsis sp. cmx-4-61]|uniref:hypothetical protein n=1 Tax=Amycolatopsis sp. cmx-4-61 TaxID=2790937 RepID=UPI00397C6DF6
MPQRRHRHQRSPPHHPLRRRRGLGELHGNGWISAAAITHHLTNAARHHLGVADFDSRELATTIRDGIAAGRENPRILTDRPAPRPQLAIR